VRTWDWRGSLYSQGNVANISFEGQGLSNRISEKGRCESDPMVDKKREWPHYSIRAPVVRQCVRFVFFRNMRNSTMCQVRTETVCNPHTLTCQKKIMHAPFFLPCPSSSFLCPSPTISVAQDGTFPPPWPTSFRVPCHVHVPSGP